jgi:uncharacterized membrane protein YfcA
VLITELSLSTWLLFILAAFFVGIAKTSIGGLATLAVVIFASQLPARESTGALLPLLMVGDVIAVAAYRRHANWRLLARLFPWVGVGVVLGAVFVARVDDGVMRRSIGLVLIGLVVVQLLSRHDRARGWRTDPNVARRSIGQQTATAAVGMCAGFVTMVANAAGPVTTIYFLMAGLPMLEFLGTGAWLFLVVNTFKLPFSIGLGLIDAPALGTDLVLVPFVLLGALIGYLFVRRLNQQQFEWLALLLAAVSAVPLVL